MFSTWSLPSLTGSANRPPNVFLLRLPRPTANPGLPTEAVETVTTVPKYVMGAVPKYATLSRPSSPIARAILSRFSISLRIFRSFISVSSGGLLCFSATAFQIGIRPSAYWRISVRPPDESDSVVSTEHDTSSGRLSSSPVDPSPPVDSVRLFSGLHQ